MSVQARAADVIEITDNESPRQNNDHNNDNSRAFDNSIASIQLPDLTEILEGLNKKKKSGSNTSPTHSTDEIREFGRTISQFNFAQTDVDLTKPKAKAVRKPRTPKVPREPKLHKEKVAREPRIKKVPKKPVTVTERALAPFLPKQTNHVTQGEALSILEFLTPGRHAEAATPSSVKPAKVKKRTKVPAKDDELPKLSTPKTARKQHRNQKLVYPETPSSQPKDTMNIMNPSKLISLSKGHFQAGNRCPEGRLTDGGPQEITSNQESLRVLEDDDHLLDLTCLPRRVHDMDSQNGNSVLHEIPGQLDQLGDNASDDMETDPRDLQTYLDELVEVTDAEASDNDEFPVTPAKVPANVRSETMDSLRTLLCEDSSADADQTLSHSEEFPHLETNLKRMRELSNVPKRVISPKLKTDSSPKTAKILQIDSDPPSGPARQLDEDVRKPRPAEDNTPSIGHSTQKTTYVLSSSPPVLTNELTNDVVQLDISDAHWSTLPSKSKRPQADTTTKSAPKPRGRPKKNISTPALLSDRPIGSSSHKVPQNASEGKITVSDMVANDVILTKATAIEKDKEYWVVPDSEDDEPMQSRIISTQRSPVKQLPPTTRVAPEYKDYTTLQLQTELSRFGFKISKNRAGMVDLLHKCWLAKQEQVYKEQLSAPTASRIGAVTKTKANEEAVFDLQVLDLSSVAISSTLPSSSDKTNLSKVKETREQKAARVVVEKIAKAKAKELKTEQKAAQKLAEVEAKKLQKLALKEATEASKVVEVQTLFRNLTSLLKSKEGHVWWIRILKYEPIVLEDFVEWLRDAKQIVTEVDTVRDYFDGKGVCCVKRITRAGKGRKRF